MNTVAEIKKSLEKEIYMAALQAVERAVFDAVKDGEMEATVVFNSKVTDEMIYKITNKLIEANYTYQLDQVEESNRVKIFIIY